MWVNLTASQPQVCVLVCSSGSVSRSSTAAARRKHGICSMVLAAGAGWQHWQSSGGSAAAARRQRAAWQRCQQCKDGVGSAAMAVTAAAVAQQRWAVGKQGYRAAAMAAVERWHSFIPVLQCMNSFFLSMFQWIHLILFSPHLIKGIHLLKNNEFNYYMNSSNPSFPMSYEWIHLFLSMNSIITIPFFLAHFRHVWHDWLFLQKG